MRAATAARADEFDTGSDYIKWLAMMQFDRIEDYLQRLTPLARSNLLTELERLEVCGNEIPGSAPLLEKLRAELQQLQEETRAGLAAAAKGRGR